VWLVDGRTFAKNIDEEFTNFGPHLSFPKIRRTRFGSIRKDNLDEQDSSSIMDGEREL